MCIYCGTDKYRKIYEQHYGVIPKDENNRSYEIHHIDGNHDNNSPENLQCVSIQEHYDAHHARQDFAACLLIAKRAKLSPEEISNLARQSQLKLVNSGIHPWQGDGEYQREIQLRKIANGTHHFCDPDWQEQNAEIVRGKVRNKTHHWCGGDVQRKTMMKVIEEGKHNASRRPDGSSMSSDRVKAGTHHWLGSSSNMSRLENGTHPSQQKWKCPHCGRQGNGTGNYVRHHGHNCKLLKSK